MELSSDPFDLKRICNLNFQFSARCSAMSDATISHHFYLPHLSNIMSKVLKTWDQRFSDSSLLLSFTPHLANKPSTSAFV
jgi:hypothetical protein